MDEWIKIEEQQRVVCQLNKVDWKPIDGSKLVAINESIYNAIEPINGLRHPAEGNATGWYIWSGGEIPQGQDDFFKPIHVEHLIEDLPDCLKYLGLPFGWRFQIDRKGYEDIWYDSELLKI
ncbi:immunity protein Imm33 domain-containing protein [Flagellimonas beolgyonensis]|uniref:immunity protein Imm33 domain-containing protein n=1 Tax=Flagellimonas beolgyonensis TaxID=864064 RepID=UPI003D649E44